MIGLRTGCCFLALAGMLRAQGPAAPAIRSTRAPAETNPFESARDIDRGHRLFQTHCSYCHGANGEGGRGANLRLGEYRHGSSAGELFETVRNGIPGTEMGSVRASDDDVWRLVAFVTRLGQAGAREKPTGDPAAGKAVYDSKGGCAACHAVRNQGGTLGPDLTDIGRRRGLDSLAESLLEPDADLPTNYRGVRVVTKAGDTVVGIRLNEDDFSIQLRDTGGNLRSFLKNRLQEIARGNPSLMPAYGAILSARELQDLIAYLSSLRGTP